MLCVQAAPPPPSLRFLLRPARAHYTAVDVKYCKGLLVLLLLGIRDREKFRRRCAVELEARVPHRLVKRRHQLLELLVVDPARVVGVVAREHLRRVGARRLHPQCRQRRVQLTGVNVATVVGVERLEDRPNGSVVAAPQRGPSLGKTHRRRFFRRMVLHNVIAFEHTSAHVTSHLELKCATSYPARCLDCRAMATKVAALKEEYDGRVNFVSIDAGKVVHGRFSGPGTDAAPKRSQL